MHFIISPEKWRPFSQRMLTTPAGIIQDRFQKACSVGSTLPSRNLISLVYSHYGLAWNWKSSVTCTDHSSQMDTCCKPSRQCKSFSVSWLLYTTTQQHWTQNANILSTAPDSRITRECLSCDSSATLCQAQPSFTLFVYTSPASALEQFRFSVITHF